MTDFIRRIEKTQGLEMKGDRQSSLTSGARGRSRTDTEV